MPIRQISTFSQLTDVDRRRAGQVGLLVVAVRLGLWLIPYRVIRRTVDAAPRRERKGAQATVPPWIARDIVAISRLVPGASCLTQALAAYLLLRREGFDPKLQLGVARESGMFKAHAWVECNGEFVVGDFRGGAMSYATLQDARSGAMPKT